MTLTILNKMGMSPNILIIIANVLMELEDRRTTRNTLSEIKGKRFKESLQSLKPS